MQWSYVPRSSHITAGIAMLILCFIMNGHGRKKAVTSAEISPGFSGYCTKSKLSFRQKFLTKLLSAGL
jgi:hypothetical protein